MFINLYGVGRLPAARNRPSKCTHRPTPITSIRASTTRLQAYFGSSAIGGGRVWWRSRGCLAPRRASADVCRDWWSTAPDSYRNAMKIPSGVASLAKGLRRPSVGAGLVVLLGGVAVTVFGLADVPVGWIICGTALLILVGYLAGGAIEPGVSDKKRVQMLWGSLLGLVVFVAGTWSYSTWWDPASRREAVEFVLRTDDETSCLRLSGEPGGSQLVLAPGTARGLAPLCGGNSYPFDCKVTLREGDTWLRLAGTRYWAPASALRPRNGLDRRDVPDCE
jgi:hypothetical protein